MPTNAKTKSKRAALRRSHRASPAIGSAIALLKQDHREVAEMFDNFEGLKNKAAKGKLAKEICLALKVHTQIEEEIFYPAARKATGDNDLLDEALVEHAGARRLIAEIEKMKPGDELFDAKVTVLGEQIRHHVEEEEDELFPEIEDSKMDVAAIGKQMAARKKELMAGSEKMAAAD